jgi:hypothetical protein
VLRCPVKGIPNRSKVNRGSSLRNDIELQLVG